VNDPSVFLPKHLSKYILLLVFTEIALPIVKMFLSKMPLCCIVPRPLLSMLVLREQLIAKALKTPFWLVGLEDMLFSHLQETVWSGGWQFGLQVLLD
jgi:hypothetical protein